jgi:hypothetical protein
VGALTCPSTEIGRFLPPGFPGKAISGTEKEIFARLSRYDKESFTKRLKRHLTLLGLEQPEGRAQSYYTDNKEEGLSAEQKQTLSRLIFIVDNLGGSFRSWSLDKEKLLAVNDGTDAFLTNLERTVWTEFINSVEAPELFERFAKSGKDKYYPYRPVVYFGGSGEAASEAQARKEICAELVEKSQQALKVLKADTSAPVGTH